MAPTCRKGWVLLKGSVAGLWEPPGGGGAVDFLGLSEDYELLTIKRNFFLSLTIKGGNNEKDGTPRNLPLLLATLAFPSCLFYNEDLNDIILKVALS